MYSQQLFLIGAVMLLTVVTFVDDICDGLYTTFVRDLCVCVCVCYAYLHFCNVLKSTFCTILRLPADVIFICRQLLLYYCPAVLSASRGF